MNTLKNKENYGIELRYYHKGAKENRWNEPAIYICCPEAGISIVILLHTKARLIVSRNYENHRAFSHYWDVCNLNGLLDSTQDEVEGIKVCIAFLEHYVATQL